MLPAGLDIIPMGPDTLLITWPQEPTPGLARLLGALAERGRAIDGVRDAGPDSASWPCNTTQAAGILLTLLITASTLVNKQQPRPNPPLPATP